MTPVEAMRLATERELLARDAVRDAMAALERAIKVHGQATARLRDAEVAWAIGAERDSRRGRR